MKSIHLILGSPQRLGQFESGIPSWVLACRISQLDGEGISDLDYVRYRTNLDEHAATGKLSHRFLGQLQVTRECRSLTAEVIQSNGASAEFQGRFCWRLTPQTIKLVSRKEPRRFQFSRKELIVLMPLVDEQIREVPIPLNQRAWVARVNEWCFREDGHPEEDQLNNGREGDDLRGRWDRATVMRHAQRLITLKLIIAQPKNRRGQPYRASKKALELVKRISASDLPVHR